MTLTVATWNVNSVKARLPHLLRWLGDSQPDVVLLQEIKVVDAAFPREEVGDLGYNVALVGQKSYNGVAILSKSPIDVLQTTLPGDQGDGQARYIEGFSAGVRLASIYAPNGNPVSSEKFHYKLSWLDRLAAHTRGLLASDDIFVFGGDFNVAPEDRDVYDPEGWRDDALCRPDSRAALRAITFLGVTDAIRARIPDKSVYTWWDYRRGAWANDEGLRIDHLLLSPSAADRLADVGIDRAPRGWDKASDHTPVWCRINPPR